MVEIDRRSFIAGAIAAATVPAFDPAPTLGAPIEIWRSGCATLTVMDVGTLVRVKAALLANEPVDFVVRVIALSTAEAADREE